MDDPRPKCRNLGILGLDLLQLPPLLLLLGQASLPSAAACFSSLIHLLVLWGIDVFAHGRLTLRQGRRSDRLLNDLAADALSTLQPHIMHAIWVYECQVILESIELQFEASGSGFFLVYTLRQYFEGIKRLQIVMLQLEDIDVSCLIIIQLSLYSLHQMLDRRGDILDLLVKISPDISDLSLLMIEIFVPNFHQQRCLRLALFSDLSNALNEA